jgi:DNA modification methylase
MLIKADARRIPLRDRSVQTIVTSPPYWGLRDYGTASWEGGDPTCTHRAPDEAGRTQKPSAGQREHAGRFAGPTCWACGARRLDRQIGLEASPAEYVATIVNVGRELWRVLRDDGTLWMNLGDSYATGTTTDRMPTSINGAAVPASWSNRSQKERCGTPLGLKTKDLVGIPWRVAFALQADGWYLRSDIIWSKPNPMPESATDRPTKAHEYIFLLTKSERYYFDADAIREPASDNTHSRGNGIGQKNLTIESGQRIKHNHDFALAIRGHVTERNKRSVWHVATEPYPEAHFATFPEALIEPCILAGARLGDIVLDPFIGSGTTGAVCDRLMRRWVGLDLAYHDLAKARTAQRGLPMMAPEPSAVAFEEARLW